MKFPKLFMEIKLCLARMILEWLQKYSELGMRTLILSKLSATARFSKSKTSLVITRTAGQRQSNDPKVNEGPTAHSH